MTVSKQIENRIHGHDPGWVFSPADFLDLGSPHTVGMALIRMVREGQIRRLARGIYDFPRKHEHLGLLSPSVDMIAEALARRDGVRIQPSEAAAANMLHLSEQVPMRVVYETDGPARKIKVGTLTIQFRRRAPRKMATAGKMSGLVFAALRGVGKRYVTQNQIAHLRQLMTQEDRKSLLIDLPQAPVWMHPFLRFIAGDE
ncbi:MAG: hypothetical protein A2X85_11265 [Geobacteraceae bacterium GWF2_54_21]|nr:MAG: hypothetical protein A2X85_11265 [Geobacteraceae bacterium GWF2_54_21]